MTTNTKYIQHSQLSRNPEFHTTIIKLMMAHNDLQSANTALKYQRELDSKSEFGKVSGSTLYFIRLQWSHLYEGLKIISEIEKDESLRLAVTRCSEYIQKQYNELLKYADKKGEYRSDVERYVGRLRNNIVFHYATKGKQIKKSIEHIGDKTTSITRGTDAHLWRFGTADTILEDIVVNQIWKHDDEEKAMTTEQVVDFIEKIHLAFRDFCGEYIWRLYS